jgi:outer membrane receptor protein involved in Fe transport
VIVTATRMLGALLASLALASPVLAQQGVVVSGRVVDETAAGLPRARVALGGARGSRFATTGADGRYRFDDVALGTYKLTARLTGFAIGEQDVSVAGAAVEAPPLTLKIALRGEEVVVSASKSEIALVDAPATMSVVGPEQIEASPAQNYGDLLRSVPGVNVVQTSARDVNLTSRQAASTLVNSQLTLLDGRSIYLDFFGLTLWDFVPATTTEIKQIEVVRGPASAVWGANALTGVVNIITRSPREAEGVNLALAAGLNDRDAGSTAGEGAGKSLGGSFSYARAPNDRWSYRLAAGYYHSDSFPRPVGTVPRATHPLDSRIETGGVPYPADRPPAAPGDQGRVFRNTGTEQPKVDLRVDQELGSGRRMSYSAGYAGTEGIIHTGIGPFDIEPGSYMAYGRTAFARGAWKVAAFANLVDVSAPNLLLADPATGKPLALNFRAETFDFEAGHSAVVGGRHVLTYGANARRNNFDIALAPGAKDRNEFGAYLQDEVPFGKFRLALGARVDKFGNLHHAVFSPRLAATFKPAPSHSIRVSFNRAFRAPSAVNNFLEQDLFAPTPIDLRPLAPLAPPALRPALSAPFVLRVKSVGNRSLKEESISAYELAYTGTFAGRTTVGIAVYQNDGNDNINFTQITPSPTNPRGLPGFDVYTPANAPATIGVNLAGEPVPAAVIGFLAALPPAVGPVVLPRTVATYLNLGPLRQRGLEVSVDHAFSRGWSAFANYSFQDDPEPLEPDADQLRYPIEEIGVPPRSRANAGVLHNGRRLMGSASLSYVDKAFWVDVLSREFHGFTDSYVMLNASFGVKWGGGKVTTSLKGTNLTNEDIQQHVFGDILKRSLVAEVRVKVK